MPPASRPCESSRQVLKAFDVEPNDEIVEGVLLGTGMQAKFPMEDTAHSIQNADDVAAVLRSYAKENDEPEIAALFRPNPLEAELVAELSPSNQVRPMRAWPRAWPRACVACMCCVCATRRELAAIASFVPCSALSPPPPAHPLMRPAASPKPPGLAAAP